MTLEVSSISVLIWYSTHSFFEKVFSCLQINTCNSFSRKEQFTRAVRAVNAMHLCIYWSGIADIVLFFS